jgi:hypothetical protein
VSKFRSPAVVNTRRQPVEGGSSHRQEPAGRRCCSSRRQPNMIAYHSLQAQAPAGVASTQELAPSHRS